MQILGLNADSHDVTAPSVLVFTDSHRYVFNVGEGFQRFCAERRLKLQRTNRIMLTRVNAASAGGLTGMLLTMSDGALTAQGAGNGAGNASTFETRRVDVHAPASPLRALIRATKTLFGQGRGVAIGENGRAVSVVLVELDAQGLRRSAAAAKP